MTMTMTVIARQWYASTRVGRDSYATVKGAVNEANRWNDLRAEGVIPCVVEVEGGRYQARLLNPCTFAEAIKAVRNGQAVEAVQR